jgi:hypothetical protein
MFLTPKRAAVCGISLHQTLGILMREGSGIEIGFGRDYRQKQVGIQFILRRKFFH